MSNRKLEVKLMLTQAENICFKSANEIINVRINETNGPELKLSDNSVIIFESYSQYYAFIKNNDNQIYNPETNEFDIDKMKELYLQKEDDAADVIYRNTIVYRVEEYKMDNSAAIYRFIE